MKLLKFNLIFLPLLALALAGVSAIARDLLEANAREQVLQIARLIMEAASSSRTYTTKQVAPLLQHDSFKLQAAVAEFQKTINELPKDLDPNPPKDIRSAAAKKAYLLGQQRFLDQQKEFADAVKTKPDALLDTTFHPQIVPAFAATEITHFASDAYKAYSYKEATLNPTNPRDRSSDWETDVINGFRKDDKKVESITPRDTATGPVLVLAHPLRVNNVSCLTCHSTPDKAPPEMLEVYGRTNGFGWTLNEVIGAQIVTVPMSAPIEHAHEASNQLTTWLIYAFFGIAFAANLGLALLLWRSNLPPRSNFTPSTSGKIRARNL